MLGDVATVSSILTPEECPVTNIVNIDGSAELIVVCEHAANTIPTSLGTLGLSGTALSSHIAWDLGALAVSLELSKRFDAPLIATRYSRLVYDCNRAPDAPDALPESSEACAVPGNRNLDETARSARFQEFYVPFRDALTSILDARSGHGRQPAIVTVHSFTPTFFGAARTVELGILHDEDARLADALLHRAAATTGLRTERNAPYGPADGTTHTLRVHALPRGLPNLMLEIKHDLIADDTARRRITTALARLLEEGLADLGAASRSTAPTAALRG